MKKIIKAVLLFLFIIVSSCNWQEDIVGVPYTRSRSSETNSPVFYSGSSTSGNGLEESFDFFEEESNKSSVSGLSYLSGRGRCPDDED